MKQIAIKELRAYMELVSITDRCRAITNICRWEPILCNPIALREEYLAMPCTEKVLWSLAVVHWNRNYPGQRNGDCEW